MRPVLLVPMIVLALAASAAAQQGQVGSEPSADADSEATQGAGSTGDVTTGTSSGDSDEAETVEPLAVEMPYPPEEGSVLGLPGSLPITSVDDLRCDVIEDANARDRCEGATANSETAR